MSVLFYHRVADEHPNDWTISTQQFERHVDHCRRHCELVSLDEVQRRVASGRNDRPTVTFTFDDGYAENCRFALPLLIRHRVPTVYFVATQNVIKQRPFPHDKQAGMALPVNTPEEIVAAADGGIEIGLHTRTHPDFSAITDIDQVRREIIEGKFELEDMIGRPVRYFAVPYGMPAQLTRAVIQVTREAGLAGFCSAFGAYNLPGRDPFHIRRIHGDPQFCRLQNWLSFDSRKLKHEPEIQVDSVVESTPPDAPSHPSSPSIECAP
ncbi:MAG: polysaccharide deacetylase family protein [Planctomycetota bacterium]